MTRMTTTNWLCIIGLLAACSGGTNGASDTNNPDATGDTGGTVGGITVEYPSALIVTQERMELADFEALTAEDAALGEVATGLALTEAGILTDSDGVEVVWAEGTDGIGAIRTAVRHCLADDCVHAVQTATGTGLLWSDASGAAIGSRTVGRPVLLKNLEAHDLDGKTVVAAQGLSTTDIDYIEPGAVPSYDYATRTFVALNTFGGAFGTPMSGALAVAALSDVFDDVNEIQYIREDAIKLFFESLDGLDAVVWLTQSVREETQGGWLASRTIGYTANRGGFGDTTVDRNELGELLNFNLAGGPGLIVLAASGSYSDGSSVEENVPGEGGAGSAWKSFSDKDRILVGIHGTADVEEILGAVEAFLDAFLDGETRLEDALEAGSSVFTSDDTRLVSNQFEIDLGRTWVPTPSKAWDTLGFYPTSALIRVPIAATPYCGAAGATRQAGDEDMTQPFSDITFDGMSFYGTNQASETTTVTIRGTVTGFEVNDRLFLEVWGDFDDEFRGFHGFGEGIIRDVETDDDGEVTIGFNGTAFATPYTNDKGESCILNGPQLQTTTSVLAAIVLTP